MKAWFHRTILKRRWTTFFVMGIAFFCFGAGTLNLFMLLKANFNLLVTHGLMSVMDGGLQQLVELLVTGYLSLAAYLIFKACEHHLVHRMTHMKAGDAGRHGMDQSAKGEPRK